MTNRALRLQNFLRLFCLGIFGLVGSVGAFSGGIWAAIGIVAAFVLYLGTSSKEKRILSPCPSLLLWVFSVLVLLALETAVSVDPFLSFKTWLHLASIFLPLSLLFTPQILTTAYTPTLISVSFLSATLGALALGLELSSGGLLLHFFKHASNALTEYNRGIAQLAILTFAVAAGLWVTNARTKGLILAALLLFPATLTESHTAKLALMVGVLASLSAWFLPRATRTMLRCSFVLMAPWPFYAQSIFSHDFTDVEKLPPSWRHRMEIWDYLSYRISEHPILGSGLGTTHMLDFENPHGSSYVYATAPAPHAHNFIVQLWTECGALGVLLMGGFLFYILRSTEKLDPRLQPFALGCFSAALTVSMFGFDFWTDALWASFALSALFLLMLQQNIEGQKDLSLPKTS